MLANGGAKAVRADQQIALGGAAVGEVGGHRPLGLREAPDAAATVIALRRKRIPQCPIDALPRGQDLGTRARARQPAGRIEDLALRDLDPEIGRIDPQPPQRRDQIRLRDDAGAAARKLALHPLEHVDVPAGAPQQQRRQQTAHGAADHQRAPLAPLAQLPRSHFLPDKSCYIPGQTSVAVQKFANERAAQ